MNCIKRSRTKIDSTDTTDRNAATPRNMVQQTAGRPLARHVGWRTSLRKVLTDREQALPSRRPPRPRACGDGRTKRPPCHPDAEQTAGFAIEKLNASPPTIAPDARVRSEVPV
ncbi:MAG: hypothetical protein EOS18_31260 [Mesorhizobium sp.]|nr:MAG: hypothetical protein EOS18_31260 [Mesorhizobium sp.]